jgi:molybdenum cofactor cytidylyltransferase
MSKIGAVILAAGESSRFGRPKQLLEFRGQTLLRRSVNAATGAGCSPIAVVVATGTEQNVQPIHHLPPTPGYSESLRQQAARQAGNSLPEGEEKTQGWRALQNSIVRELEQTEAIIVENQSWRRGIGTSIRAGVQTLINGAAEIQNRERRLPNRPAAVGKPPLLEAVVILVCDQPFVDARVIRGLIAVREKTNQPIVASAYSDTLGVPALFDHSCFGELLQLSGESGAKSIIMRNRERVAEFPSAEGEIDIDTVADYEKLK